jgi:hypothetical protein
LGKVLIDGLKMESRAATLMAPLEFLGDLGVARYLEGKAAQLSYCCSLC